MGGKLMARLDRKITFRRRSSDEDAWGGQSETWSDVATVWASFTPVSDGERWRAGQSAALEMARFQVRYHASLAGVTATDAIQFNGKDWNIIGAKEIGRRKWLEFTATWTNVDGA